ncbi:MAG TPA: DcaP family trimeric outer membrane transporter [Caulobacteraceae bacterium]|nr:DcaP family trimeric outer membrane transporter [Caulobacteraceae bacterium]
MACSQPQRRTRLLATIATIGGLGLAGLTPAGAARAQTAPALSAQEVQELRAELKAIKAESDAAKVQEADRESRIAALQRRLDMAAGVPPAAPEATASPPAAVPAEAERESNPEVSPAPAASKAFEIYGAAQLDYIQDFNRVDPSWEASLRPSKIPTVAGQFGSDGQSIFSVRQSKFGATATQEIGGHELFVKFEFDLYATGDHAGETTFHLQHFFGRWGPILAGKTDSVFMDGDLFPNTIEYWGPPGMVYVRTAQLRLTWKQGPHEIAGAIEEPFNDIDPGNLRILDPALAGLQGDEKIPDFTGHYRYDSGWGHVQVAGILRRVGFETIGTPNNVPKGSRFGWGVNLTSNVNVTKNDVVHLGVVYGEGIASFMNDGGTDLAPGGSLLLPATVQAEVVPLLGVTAYLDHQWNSQFSSSIGYSRTQVDNRSLQAGDAFRTGQYASVNLLWTPDPHLMFGGELMWGQREDKSGATGDDSRIQFSAKYKFTSKDFFQ